MSLITDAYTNPHAKLDWGGGDVANRTPMTSTRLGQSGRKRGRRAPEVSQLGIRSIEQVLLCLSSTSKMFHPASSLVHNYEMASSGVLGSFLSEPVGKLGELIRATYKSIWNVHIQGLLFRKQVKLRIPLLST